MDDCDLGPIASSEQFERVRSFLDGASDQGVRVLFGGDRPSYLDRGYFIEPTLIECPDLGQPIAREEVFGPVATILPFKSEDEVIRMCNSTKYGLSASVFSKNISKAHRVAAKIDSGIIWINSWLLRDLRVPFGGMKHSGVGREGGYNSLNFFTESKNVCVKIEKG